MEMEIKMRFEIEWILFYFWLEIREKKKEMFGEVDTSLIGGRWPTTKSTRFKGLKNVENDTNVKSAERQLVTSSLRSVDLTLSITTRMGKN